MDHVTRSDAGFGRLARWYRALEMIAFGRDLERARFAFIDRVRDCREILLLGEGDGRCAERVAALAPLANILCVDSSAGMVACARRRLQGTPAADRVRFICADIGDFEPEPQRFDAVCTLFFLDCFETERVARIVGRVGRGLRPGAPWLFADFVLPERGYDRLRARAWLGLLYAFFRWQTGLSVRRLPASEAVLMEAGWRPVRTLTLQRGMLRTAVLERPGA